MLSKYYSKKVCIIPLKPNNLFINRVLLEIGQLIMIKGLKHMEEYQYKIICNNISSINIKQKNI